MKTKHIIVAATVAIGAFILLHNKKSTEEAGATADHINKPQPSVIPELLGITLGTSLGDVLKIPAVQSSPQIKCGGKWSSKQITTNELSKIYEDAKANLNSVSAVQSFVKTPQTEYIITVSEKHEYLGFEIAELQLRTTYSPDAEDFIIDKLGATLRGSNFDAITGKICVACKTPLHIRDPRRELPNPDAEWRSVGKDHATIRLDTNCRFEVESDIFNTRIKGQHYAQEIALKAGYVKLDYRKAARDSLKELQDAQKRMEAEKKSHEKGTTPAPN